MLREAAAETVLPHYQRLRAGDVAEKAAGEVVTVADTACESWLTPRLHALLPDSIVVGEEATAADPALLTRVGGAGWVWLLDPVDGTGNFAAGREPFAVMAALVREGETIAAWLLDPVSDSLVTAERGGGAWQDGAPLRAPSVGVALDELHGSVHARYLPMPLREEVRERATALGTPAEPLHCAGAEYPAVITGARHFSLYWRTLPWDHAPGVLIAQEAGAAAARPDGTPYFPADDRRGLLLATDQPTWEKVQRTLFPSGVDG